MTFSSAPLPKVQANPAPAQPDHLLAPLHKEAVALMNNERVIKSESNREMMVLFVRFIEVLMYGKPRTEARPKHHE
jgi:hypothetical protein